MDCEGREQQRGSSGAPIHSYHQEPRLSSSGSSPALFPSHGRQASKQRGSVWNRPFDKGSVQRQPKPGSSSSHPLKTRHTLLSSSQPASSEEGDSSTSPHHTKRSPEHKPRHRVSLFYSLTIAHFSYDIPYGASFFFSFSLSSELRVIRMYSTMVAPPLSVLSPLFSLYTYHSQCSPWGVSHYSELDFVTRFFFFFFFLSSETRFFSFSPALCMNLAE